MNFHSNQLQKIRHNKLPALPLTFVCLTVWLVGILFATDTILKTPYFGASFVRNGTQPGLIVKSVAPEGPAAMAGLSDTMVITAIGSLQLETKHVLSDVAGVHDRSEIGTYEEWTRSTNERPAIWELINSGTVIFELFSGGQIEITPSAGRSWASLPSGYWITLIHSLSVLLISIGFLAFAPRTPTIGLLFLSGMSLSANFVAHGFRSAEELVFSPEFWTPLYVMSNLSAVMFAYALLAMLWHTPQRLNAFPFAPLAIGFSVLAFTVQHFQWFAFPIHAYQFPYILAIVLAVGLIVFKWVKSRGKPLDRATLSWVVLSILVAVFPWMIIYSLPLIAGNEPLIHPNFASAMLTVVYVGFAFGAIKFRLFGMQTIWLWSLVWMSTAIGLVLVDLVLLTQLHWKQSQALPTAIVLASWGFFPLKNYILNRWSDRNSISLKDESLNLFDQLNSTPFLAEFDGRFIRAMKNLFQAVEIDVRPNAVVAGVVIQENGLSLAIPAITKNDTIILRGRSNGQRLFSNGDRIVSENLIALARRIYEQKSIDFTAREVDRRQIVRDLHDDVGSKILNLIYSAPEESNQKKYADQALKALKDSLMTIENDEGLDIETYWTKFWQEQIERLNLAGFKTDTIIEFERARVVAARDFVNMKRIVEEHVSNITKYAANDVAVEGITRVLANGDFTIEILSGMQSGQSTSNLIGRGAANIKARAEELDAHIEIGPGESELKRFRLFVLLPLTE